ncbi:MAG: hypothetical protein HGA28_06270, partial [Anaerolineaceae bacterium]|nr:hypothetical protein [Anaerolineaceae bacterium]
YSAITLPDGTIPANWGQFKKSVFEDKENAKNNLGSVKSGHAEEGLSDEDSSASGSDSSTFLKDDKGNGKGNENGNTNVNNGKEKGGSKDKGKGKGK